MRYLTDAAHMKETDKYTIEEVGIPSLVLMERAAYSVSSHICSIEREHSTGMRALCVCGYGNNGADGLAVARQLMQKGFTAEVLCAGNRERATEEFLTQEKICRNLGVSFRNSVHEGEYDYIIDAVFGIGLSREITGVYRNVIEDVNLYAETRKCKVISVDIPSGINADTGQVMGVAVKADSTVTFGCEKLGLALYPGREYAGYVETADAGFAYPAHFYEQAAVTYDKADSRLFPQRHAYVNKGDCGKVLLIAGNENMGGAACMAAMSAYRSGSGLVRVFTHANNRIPLLAKVSEAITETYNEKADNELTEISVESLKKSVCWSDCIIAGPGLGKSRFSVSVIRKLLEILELNPEKRLIIDADALNIISEHYDISQRVSGLANDVIMTPHIAEMSRLMGLTAENIKTDAVNVAKQGALKYNAIMVMKDAASVVTDGKRVYVNTSGNAGLATAGSGDVLTGIIASMLNSGFEDNFRAAAMGVHIHGICADNYKERYNMRSMSATDIVEELRYI